MAQYNVSLRYDIEVEADNEKEAEQKAKEEVKFNLGFPIIEDIELLDN